MSIQAFSTFENLGTSAMAELAMQKMSNTQQLVKLGVKKGKGHIELLWQAIMD